MTEKEISKKELETYLALIANPKLKGELEKHRTELSRAIRLKYQQKIVPLQNQIKELEIERDDELLLKTGMKSQPVKRLVGSRTRRGAAALAAEKQNDLLVSVDVLKHIVANKEHGIKRGDLKALTDRPGQILRLLLDQNKIISTGVAKGTKYFPA